MFELLILEGAQAGRRLPLGGRPVTFGRSPQATLSFPGDGFMSGMHLQVAEIANGVAITDLRSTNGTFVNEQRIQQAVGVVGDVIRLGSLSMRVVFALPAVGTAGVGKGPVFSSPPLPGALAGFPGQAALMDRSQVAEARPGAPGGALGGSMTGTLSAASLADLEIAKPTVVGAPREAGSLAAMPPPPIKPLETPTQPDAVLSILRGAGQPVFCLVDAAVDPMIYSLLTVGAEKHPTQSLYEGDSAVTLAPWAPYLLSVTPESPLLRVLLEKGWGKAWASYFLSPAPFAQLRHHFRRFLMVQIEQGQQVYFRFYDPRVLRDFLPTATAAELTMFFGPVTEWLLEATDSSTLLRMRAIPGGLATTPVPVAAPAS